MYRFGGTGVWAAVQAAVDLMEPAVAYPVRSLTSFATEIGNSGASSSSNRNSGGDSGGGGGGGGGGSSQAKGVFADCYLLRKGTTVRQLASLVLGERGGDGDGDGGRSRFSYAEVSLSMYRNFLHQRPTLPPNLALPGPSDAPRRHLMCCFRCKPSILA